MKPFRIDNDVRRVEFCDETPEGALAMAVHWLEEKDKTGRENAFYFYNLVIEHESEIGWVVTLFCGKDNR